MLCANYFNDKDTGEAKVEYFVERMDHLQDKYYIDPFNLGQVD